MKKLSFLLLLIIVGVCSRSAAAQGKTSMAYVEEASRHYLARDFNKAIPPYEKALDLEKQERKLTKDLWFVLIDNLAISYGITGDIARSKEVLEYGISREPTYPLFYYNMACGYGESDDEAGAVKNLRLAFKYKANMIKGETFPDPETDSSFRRLMKKESFRKAIGEMKGGS